jgi:hypothetical protein
MIAYNAFFPPLFNPFALPVQSCLIRPLLHTLQPDVAPSSTTLLVTYELRLAQTCSLCPFSFHMI